MKEASPSVHWKRKPDNSGGRGLSRTACHEVCCRPVLHNATTSGPAMASRDGSCFRSPNTKTPHVALPVDDSAVTDTTRTPASSRRRHLKSAHCDESGAMFPIRRSAAKSRLRRFRTQRSQTGGSTPTRVPSAVTGRVHTCVAGIGGGRHFPAPAQRQVRRSRRAVADSESDCRSIAPWKASPRFSEF